MTSQSNAVKLYDHQKKILERFPHRHLLAWGTGTGKTITALALADKANESAVIVVPKALKTQWEIIIRNYQSSNPSKHPNSSNSLHHLVLTKEEFKKRITSPHNPLPKYNCIIIDEAHYFSGMKSQLSKSLYKYCKTYNPEYRWLLTATPYLSSPWNIYVLAKHLGYDLSYPRFEQQFFIKIRMGMRMIPKIRAGIEDELKAIVKQIGSTVALEDCVDVPEQTFETEWFALSKEQEKAIQSLDDPTAIARWTKTHMIENGVMDGDAYTPSQLFQTTKLERIIALSEQNNKIAVFCRYRSQIEHYRSALTAHNPSLPVFVITGDTKDRHRTVNEVEQSYKCVVLIASQCSEGYELPSVSVCVFASLDFSLKNYIQSLGRFLRINRLKKNHYIFLVNEAGVDRAVYDSIMAKQDFHIELYRP